MEKNYNIGPKLSVIAKAKGFTQKELAEKCGISRLAVQRFFKGHTELKCRDCLNLMGLLGFNVEEQINNSMESPENTANLTRETDISILIKQLNPQVQKVLIEQILWWAQQESLPQHQHVTSKIKIYLENLNKNLYRGVDAPSTPLYRVSP